MTPPAVGKMIDALIEREGFFVDHPSDRGGPTMYGVTHAVARAYGYAGPMEIMPRQMAFTIYRERYWNGPRFDRVDAIAPVVAEELFDTGANMGTGVAARFLQRALNVLNQRVALYPDLVVDGAVGAMTLEALRAFIARRGPEGARVLRNMLNALQSVRYIEIAEADDTQLDFEYGWQRVRASNATGVIT